MKFIICFCLLVFLFFNSIQAQSRIKFNNKDLFLSGANIAWINFARDIGPDVTEFSKFEGIFTTVRLNGGNAMRFWLHTNGVSSPEFNYQGKVIGPGNNTISDLRKILDLAWENDMGLILCLWSFDMLRISFGETVTTRAKKMLTDTAYTNAYIRNALIPMVRELKGHPAIIAWEIFNEPEGMSNEFGWDFNYHVPMSDIQRFINLTTAAIRKTDPDVQITNGSWSFKAQSDVTFNRLAKNSFTNLSEEQKIDLQQRFNSSYRTDLTADEILQQLERNYSANAGNINYYRDDRLIAAGGDSLGVLDFYTVHYYDWGGTALSPFHHTYDEWKLDKALVVAEFYLNIAFGVPYIGMFKKLYQAGYAGALTWAWDDGTGVQPTRTKTEMKYMFNNYKNDILVKEHVIVEKPSTYLLMQNFPNPFNNTTTINYWVRESGFVILEVIDLLGERVAVLVNEVKTPNKYFVDFNGAGLASGVYFYHLKVNDFEDMNKMILLK